jgi:hypothetical protein
MFRRPDSFIAVTPSFSAALLAASLVFLAPDRAWAQG